MGPVNELDDSKAVPSTRGPRKHNTRPLLDSHELRGAYYRGHAFGKLFAAWDEFNEGHWLIIHTGLGAVFPFLFPHDEAAIEFTRRAGMLLDWETVALPLPAVAVNALKLIALETDGVSMKKENEECK